MRKSVVRQRGTIRRRRGKREGEEKAEEKRAASGGKAPKRRCWRGRAGQPGCLGKGEKASIFLLEKTILEENKNEVEKKGRSKQAE